MTQIFLTAYLWYFRNRYSKATAGDGPVGGNACVEINIVLASE
jgi:hypothetical protein